MTLCGSSKKKKKNFEVNAEKKSSMWKQPLKDLFHDMNVRITLKPTGQQQNYGESWYFFIASNAKRKR